MKKVALSALCVLVLVALLLPSLVGAGEEIQVYQLAVNDVFMDTDTGLTAGNMPVEVGGTIYVPYTTFDKGVTRVDLGVSYSQNREGDTHTLTIYNLSGTIVFDINAQTCTVGGTGESLDMRAIIRNGRVYVPANGVCQFFDLQYSYRPIRSAGVLIRIKNSYAVLTDAQFVQSGASFMQSRYNKYVQSLAPSVPSVSPGEDPVTPPVLPSADPEKPGVWVYLGVECTGSEGMEKILETLDWKKAYGVFFFDPESLADQEALVRQVLGQGHQVGLVVDGSNPSAAQGALERGNALLERIAWTRTHTVYLKNASRETRTLLADQGWNFWNTQVDGRPSAASTYLNTANIVTQVKAKQNVARVLLNDSQATAASISRLLLRLEEADCFLRTPLETELG